ncbi:sterol desaturase family protein [Oceanicoccus sp. KOV_DT_Chl]|uniref:sterol desaturase family protein n=1 Tax=Oceanicoccus sp. KOV_DT_Chl TaxID=1904639 RepID=UPI000C7AFFD1|nr:sterol desaturase family protein [Oceanicoccus sp. KOV_DT_Chl]
MTLAYNWPAGLITVLLVIGIITISKFLLFRIPALANSRETDEEKNKDKWRNKGKKYHHRVKASQKIGLGFSLAFYLGVLPFLVTLEPQPISKILIDSVLILMVYDFFYYLTHRFVFHGQGYFRMVHAVHHQARSRVSSIDSFLLHPWEIFIGIGLFYLVTSIICLLNGEPFHIATIVFCNIVYTQLNQINHCRIDLKGFPWKTINWIAMKHDAHHLDMHRGNYSTITLFYDWLFRTIERHPNEDLTIENTQSN